MKKALIFWLLCGAIFADSMVLRAQDDSVSLGASAYVADDKQSEFEKNHSEILLNRQKNELDRQSLQNNLQRESKGVGDHDDFSMKKQPMQDIKERNNKNEQDLKLRRKKLQGDVHRR
ncbi:hypothetical protein [uncultured Campylobacter sp.]|uniref:hypothetical protein n=1 Tax=uncultured Campylobacter sp. TaxID=218934 RepID=UPI002634848A|nr:hypothetical protein [uncultured Campylobacter sp.]